MAYTANTITKAITGKTVSTTYYYNVVVKDAAGNKSIYDGKTQATTADISGPTVGAFSASTSVTITAFTFNWAAASDDVSSAANLQYFVCSGASAAAIDTVAECEAATSEMAYATNTLTKSFSSKMVNNTYYYNVVVKDEVGNKSIYEGKTQATADTSYQKLADDSNFSFRQVEARFGYATALSADGNTMVVGAYMDDYDASGANYVASAGAAYVYVRSSGSWTLQQKLVGTGTNARLGADQFGVSVAISGDTIAVGANLQDYDASGANSVTNAGAVYVFTRSGTTWTQQQKIVPTGTNARITADNFAYKIALDGDTLAVGAYGHDYDESGANSLTDAGAAYIFTRSGTTWSQEQKLVASGTNARMAGNLFGYSIALSGNTVVVGAYADDYDAAGANALTDAGAASDILTS